MSPRSRRAAALLLPLAACVAGSLDLSGKGCDVNHPCVDGFTCAGGLCQPSGAAPLVDAGPQEAGPACGCSPGHHSVLFCDGTSAPCPAQAPCDLGSCLAACAPDGSCAPGAVCDEASEACVPAPECGPPQCGGGEICVAAVCVAQPGGGASPACGAAADGGVVELSGVIALFPFSEAADSLLDGGTVTFFPEGDGGALLVPVAPQGDLPGFSANLAPGSWTVLVQGPGVVPTYFPGLSLSPSVDGRASLLLDAVVPEGFVASLRGQAGPPPDPAHLVWVGRAATLDPDCRLDGGFLGGYTVGLSPAPGWLGYYAQTDAGASVAASPSRSDPAMGEFVALDAPWAPTRYVLAIGAGDGSAIPLLSGTFVPPQNDGEGAAVALLYPNFTR